MRREHNQRRSPANRPAHTPIATHRRLLAVIEGDLAGPERCIEGLRDFVRRSVP